ncbi:Thioesterase/thiol ester dehydrase-isomerase [Peniophora sp. CONT]|nr:Thioesterase/thiol ester dehydrase-isomerase [Peniophora sp. CONT]
MHLYFTVVRADDYEFAQSVVRRMSITEVSLVSKSEAPSRTESRVVCELPVASDMANAGHIMHGGCTGYLVDVCSTLALAAAGASAYSNVTQSLNVVYHAPAPVGHRIRVINWSVAVGSRIMSARTEIWDIDDERLVATGTHIKMKPSRTRL